MHAYSNEATRLFAPMVIATRWNWRKRRIRSRLRSVGRAVVSLMTGMWGGLIVALHESRSRSAARIFAQYRHLIEGERCDDQVAPDARPSDLAER